MRIYWYLGIFLLSFTSYAGAQIVGESRLLLNADGSNVKFAAVARLQANLTCTAFLVKTAGADTAPAYLFSNGHCIDLDANEVIVDRPPEPSHQAVFHYFQDTQDRQVKVPVKRIAYSTMKARDISILELNATLGDLLRAGITPLELETREPDQGTEVTVVGGSDRPDAGRRGVPPAGEMHPRLARRSCGVHMAFRPGIPEYLFRRKGK